MRTGGLTDILRVLAPVTVTDKFGSEEQTWETVGEYRAERVKRSGNLSTEVGEHFARISTEWNVHLALSDVFRENRRVADVRDGGTLYTITSRTPTRARGMLAVTCERLNE